MLKLKSTAEPILVLRELYALAAGGGTAAAAYNVGNLPPAVQVAAPFVVASIVKLTGWLDRRYVSPAYAGLHRKAAAAGIDLPSEAEIVADVRKVIDASIPPAPASTSAVA